LTPAVHAIQRRSPEPKVDSGETEQGSTGARAPALLPHASRRPKRSRAGPWRLQPVTRGCRDRRPGRLAGRL